MEIPISELAELVGGAAIDPTGEFSALSISGFASLVDAQPGDLAFFNHDRYLDDLKSTSASAVLVENSVELDLPDVLVMRVEDPSKAFSKAVEKYAFRPRPFQPGVHASAIIEDGVTFDPDKVSIGPNVTIETGTSIGDGTDIRAGVFVGQFSTIGNDCRIYPNTTIYHGSVLGDRISIHSNTAIGSDGFGYDTAAAGSHTKVKQVGHVQIDDDCEIGAAVTIDRARFGRTWIGSGTKIYNNCQIGHNVVIGSDCIIVAAAAIAGSAIIGSRVTIAAQVGIAGHLRIGDDTVLAARAGVTKSLPGKAAYMGFPAGPIKQEKRNLIYPRRIPEVLKRLKALEERLGELPS
ncbi:MAG: UDP-3-O-(3-hydroxymyristoyl)glucosamine N-acyltransferase [Verrucomicrobiales bacterium]